MGAAGSIGDAGQALRAVPSQGSNQIIRRARPGEAAYGNHRAIRNIGHRRIEIRKGFVARHVKLPEEASLCFAEVAPMARGVLHALRALVSVTAI